MTEKELDARIRQLLLDALKLEWEDFLNEPTEEVPIVPSARHRRQIKKMLADPQGWANRRARPVWKSALQKVAVFALVCSLILGSLLAASPQARAALKRWLREIFDTHVYYEYAGEPSTEELPEYEMTVVPEGYELVIKTENDGFIRHTYENFVGQQLHFKAAYVHDGRGLDISIDGFDIYNTKVRQYSATVLISYIQEQSNCIVWIDEDANLQFIIDGYFDAETLRSLAESVKH